MGAPIQNIQRAEAIRLGKKRYFDGQRCPEGHLSEKLVSNYTCIQCLREDFYARRKTLRSAKTKVRLARKAERIESARSLHPELAAMFPASASEARASGLRRFFNGLSCLKGHVSARLLTGNCYECSQLKGLRLAGKQLERKRKRSAAYNLENRDRQRVKTRQRYRTNIQTKLRSVLRHRIKQALRGKTKNTSALKYLGCTIVEVRAHLEKQFAPGMSWANHSHRGWHVDHIIPLASFDMTIEAERHKAFHYTNLQPLWARDNHIKHARLIATSRVPDSTASTRS